MLRITVLTLATVGSLSIATPAGADYEDPLADLFPGARNETPMTRPARGRTVARREAPAASSQENSGGHWGKHHHHGVHLEGSY